ncbi:MAG: protein-methionine-sulfoxide reductase catalytic subunit MsrP, partial [Vicinamibacterales bacterium]
MVIKKAPDLRYSDITPESVYRDRREFIKLATAAAIGATALGCEEAAAQGSLPAIPNVRKSPLSTTEKQTAYGDFTTYNNFYEFGTDKEAPAVTAKRFKTRPWTIAIEGHVAKPGSYGIDDFIKSYALEERIYRHRCVETWSAVVPWIGIPLADLIKKVEPTSKATHLEFVTLYDPSQMPGVRAPVLQWPYIEGLRLDEAKNPLALLAVGLYGQILPNQNGAPIRLVVPWKYGFKGGKSLVKIRFVDSQPKTAWQVEGPREYGFYANVNPTVDHPRWSQAREHRLGEFLPRKTLMFNGYTDQVASLYTG